MITAASAFAVAERAALEPDDPGGAVEAAAVAKDAFAGDAAFPFVGVGCNTPSVSGGALAGAMVSLVTVGNTAGGAEAGFADDCVGGSLDFEFGSWRFDGAEMLMSATMSFRTSANP